MVNIEAFAKRLTILMEYYEITAAALAEKIDVQRSSISHILSGRNKPSLDFVLKILKAFPEVELYWLLNGVGKFPKDTKDSSPTSNELISNKSEIQFKDNEKPIENLKHSKKEIERIVVFFKDGTFKNYTS